MPLHLPLISAFLVALAIVSLAQAADPAALVEEVDGNRADIMVMDLLEPGRVVTLSTDEHLTISYLTSCRQEVVTGGTLTIGATESQISGGAIKAKVVPCDSTQVAASGNEAGALVFRAPPAGENLPKHDSTIYSIYPVLKTDPSVGEALLERLDHNEKERKVVLKSGSVDFHELQLRLERKALYRVTAGAKTALFLVHSQAKSSETALISRLVRF